MSVELIATVDESQTNYMLNKCSTVEFVVDVWNAHSTWNQAMTQIFVKIIKLLMKNGINHEPIDSFMIFSIYLLRIMVERLNI